MKKILAALLTGVLAIGLLSACGDTKEPAQDTTEATVETGAEESTSVDQPEADYDKSDITVKVACKSFSESRILAELYALALEDAGYSVERLSDVGDNLLHEALTNGEIDIYPEYTGTALLTIFKQEQESDPQKVYDIVKEKYAEVGVVALDMCAANDGEGISMLASVADQYGIKTISDLQANAQNIRLGSNSDFFEREDGLAGLEKVYGKFDLKEATSFDNSLKYEIMKNGDVDCVLSYTTDAQLADPMFVLLEDDLGYWPPYNIIPVMSAELHAIAPDIEDVINKVSAAIDTDIMQELNSKVDIDLEEVEDVAADFYATIK